MVRVTWLGHSCWEIKGDDVIVLTDPHDGESLGLPVPDSNPDVVLVSHSHEDHASGVKLFKQNKVIDQPIETTVKGAKITGIKTYHDDVQGERLGENVFFKFILDEIVFGHTGDLGHILDQNSLDQIGRVDILFSGIGETAQANIELIMPRLLIPMHYHVNGIIFPWFRMPDINEFVKDKDHEMLNTNSFTYTKKKLPLKMKIHVYRLL